MLALHMHDVSNELTYVQELQDRQVHHVAQFDQPRQLLTARRIQCTPIDLAVQADNPNRPPSQSRETCNPRASPHAPNLEPAPLVDDTGDDRPRVVHAILLPRNDRPQADIFPINGVCTLDNRRRLVRTTVGQITQHGPDLLKTPLFILGHVVNGSVGAVHRRPAEVAETQSLLERRARHDGGAGIEQRPDVGGHDAEVGAHDARGAEPDGAPHDGAEVRDAHVELLDDGLED